MKVLNSLRVVLVRYMEILGSRFIQLWEASLRSRGSTAIDILETLNRGANELFGDL